MSSLPQRKPLPHEVPSWVKTGELYFITICCSPRRKNQLCSEPIKQLIWATTKVYQERSNWYCELLLLMPDHLHALIAFPGDQEMKKMIKNFKSYLSKHSTIKWQSGFFDHRLRSMQKRNETYLYILQNPVRQNLCVTRQDWNYTWTP